MKERFYAILPLFFQNCLISLYNLLAYRKRYGGDYKYFLNTFKNNRALTLEQLRHIQKSRFSDTIKNASLRSKFYSKLYTGLDNLDDMEKIAQLPIVDKEMFRKEITQVYTIGKRDGIVSKTGGTTGKSLEVLYTIKDTQERFAMLDDFRSRFGYKLGKRTAWFSGKNLLTARDSRNNIFWKTDYLHKVRYYSTFHIKDDNLKFYIQNLIEFSPEYMVGFPSTIYEIAKYGTNRGIKFPRDVIKAIFPTAETLTYQMKSLIESYFDTSMFNQYASSEGAPFIFECINRNLHLELQSGVFEVLGDDDTPSNTGRLVITSFTTTGTPLIRYDIGDSICLLEGSCSCGNNNPLVKEILGRVDDFVFSPDVGKIYLGNVSNTLKDTSGIVKFQVQQDELNELLIRLVVDDEVFDKEIENVFIKNWRDRIGYRMKIKVQYEEDIPKELSGKYRIVKNNIKHLIV